jgi:predicted transcriptional regulator
MVDQISEHEIRVYEAARVSAGWKTAKELAATADVADRTARMHCGKLAEVGVFQVAKVFGGYRYRCSEQPASAAAEYLSLLESAKRVFGEGAA